MMTGIIYIAIGIILMAIFGAIGNYHIQKARTESANSNKDEILSNQDSIKTTVLEEQTKSKNEIIDSVISNKEEVIANTNELKEGQKNLEKQIKATSKSKKPDIKVENSPNTVIQVNESGDNVIDNSTKIYTSPQRKVTEQLGEQLLKMLDERLDKYGLGRNGKIVVTTTSDAESRNFGNDIVKFLIKNNYNVYNGLNTYIGSDSGFKNLDVAFKHDEANERLELWINTLKKTN